jgi:hypothetical protein
MRSSGHPRTGPKSVALCRAGQSTEGVFLGDEVLVAASFDAARSRLARLPETSELLRVSQVAFDNGFELTARVGPAALSKLVQVQAAQLAESAGTGLAIRWQATGLGSSLFPVLDADIRLTPAGEHVTLLTLAGTYRPPLGPLGEALDRAMLRRVATATIRNFIGRLGAEISDSPDRHSP